MTERPWVHLYSSELTWRVSRLVHHQIEKGARHLFATSHNDVGILSFLYGSLGFDQGAFSSIFILASLPSVVFLFPKWHGFEVVSSLLMEVSAADHSSHLGLCLHVLSKACFLLHTY